MTKKPFLDFRAQRWYTMCAPSLSRHPNTAALGSFASRRGHWKSAPRSYLRDESLKVSARCVHERALREPATHTTFENAHTEVNNQIREFRDNEPRGISLPHIPTSVQASNLTWSFPARPGTSGVPATNSAG
uniref:Uncharacterized protein n=1 Tax=Trichogramma kaykai TaxID=54128 RepID=A0ABD2X5A5_9HYME